MSTRELLTRYADAVVSGDSRRIQSSHIALAADGYRLGGYTGAPAILKDGKVIAQVTFFYTKAGPLRKKNPYEITGLAE